MDLVFERPALLESSNMSSSPVEERKFLNTLLRYPARLCSLLRGYAALDIVEAFEVQAEQFVSYQG